MKKIELNKEELDNILKMYNEELLGTHTISIKTGISKPTINRILKENNIILPKSREVDIMNPDLKNKGLKKNNINKIYEDNSN
jgi:DNA invertase Pin-like site-specific DNA recombinase